MGPRSLVWPKATDYTHATTERAPGLPIGFAVLARTAAADDHGWRVYGVTPAEIPRRSQPEHG